MSAEDISAKLSQIGAGKGRWLNQAAQALSKADSLAKMVFLNALPQDAVDMVNDMIAVTPAQPGPPVYLSSSAYLQQWTHAFVDSLTMSEPMGGMFTSWRTGLGPSKRRCLAQLLSNFRVQECGVEPDHDCYKLCGEAAEALLVCMELLFQDQDCEFDTTTIKNHPLNQCLSVLVDKGLGCRTNPSVDKKEPDYAIVYHPQGTHLADPHYSNVLQVGELVKHTPPGPPQPLQWRDKLAQCLDHASRVHMDDPGRNVLAYEVSDGLWTRCGYAVMQGTPRTTFTTTWSPLTAQLNELQHPAWTERLFLAYMTYKTLLQPLRAAAEQRRDDLFPAGAPMPVAAGDVLEVVDDELNSNIGGLDSLQPAGADGLQQRDQRAAAARHTLHVDGALSMRQASKGMSLVLHGHLLPGSQKQQCSKAPASGVSVIAKFTTGTTAGRDEWDAWQAMREHVALLRLRRSGAPYLPRHVVFGTITSGPPEALGGHMLLVERLGDPLQQYLAYPAGLAMRQSEVVLLAACLAAACYALRAALVFHNDIRPDNITATYCPTPSGRLYHLVDLGAASCPELNDPTWTARWGALADPEQDQARVAPMGDLLFASWEALAGTPFEAVLLRPLSDLQAALYTLVYLAGGVEALPWAEAASRGDKAMAAAGRKAALDARESWSGLAVLPAPVSRFGAWVLSNARRESVELSEVEAATTELFLAVQQELGFQPPWPSLPLIQGAQ